jgi:hypothetical protein
VPGSLVGECCRRLGGTAKCEYVSRQDRFESQLCAVAEAASVLIVIEDLHRGLIVRRVTALEWLVARVRADTLDQRLAAGVAPETGPLLALRARTLVRPVVRRGYARSLRHIVRDAASPCRRFPGFLFPESRRQVNDAADVLTALAGQLESACPVSACGVAKVKLLLTDGAGPLYYPAGEDELRVAVRAAAEAMNAPVLQ